MTKYRIWARPSVLLNGTMVYEVQRLKHFLLWSWWGMVDVYGTLNEAETHIKSLKMKSYVIGEIEI